MSSVDKNLARSVNTGRLPGAKLSARRCGRRDDAPRQPWVEVSCVTSSGPCETSRLTSRLVTSTSVLSLGCLGERSIPARAPLPQADPVHLGSSAHARQPSGRSGLRLRSRLLAVVQLGITCDAQHDMRFGRCLGRGDDPPLSSSCTALRRRVLESRSVSQPTTGSFQATQ